MTFFLFDWSPSQHCVKGLRPAGPIGIPKTNATCDGNWASKSHKTHNAPYIEQSIYCLVHGKCSVCRKPNRKKKKKPNTITIWRPRQNSWIHLPKSLIHRRTIFMLNGCISGHLMGEFHSRWPIIGFRQFYRTEFSTNCTNTFRTIQFHFVLAQIY